MYVGDTLLADQGGVLCAVGVERVMGAVRSVLNADLTRHRGGLTKFRHALQDRFFP